MTDILYPRMALIGCGLIGSSVARAARLHGVVGTLAIFDANPAARERIRALGLADETLDDPRDAVANADLVMFATPPLSIGPAAALVADALKPGATITDVGSVKSAVAEAFARILPPTVYGIPGHPIAGAETSGPDAGFASLFQNRWTILTPRTTDDPAYGEALERMTRFWAALGAQVELMDEKHHDLVLAVTSHLPHLIAYNIVGTAADLEEVTRGEVIK